MNPNDKIDEIELKLQELIKQAEEALQLLQQLYSEINK